MNPQSLCADNLAVEGQPNNTAPGAHRENSAHMCSDPATLTCVVYPPTATPNGFVVLASEWNSLLARSRSNVIFLTYEWQTTWWRYQGEGELWIVAFRQAESGKLVGIAPLYRVQATSGELAGKWKFNLVGCIEVSDYLDIIASAGYEEAVYSALLNWLQSPDAPPWDILDLCNLPQQSLTYLCIPAICDQAGCGVEVFQEDVAPHFTLPLRYERYLEEQVEKKQRHEIRRKQRRAEREAEVGFYLVGKTHDLAAEVEDFIALQQASRADKAAFMTPEMRRFFHAAARTLFDAGYLRLCFLTLNGVKAAAIFAFEYDRKFLLYNSGYDPDAHAQLSPGWVLLAYAIQYAIAAGCQVFDFMQGNEEYKYRFGSHDDKVMRVLVKRAGN